MQVLTHIAGSKLVVMRSSEHYIDVKKDVRYDPSFNHIEVVHAGQVRRRETCIDSEAPERIVQLMREELLPFNPRRQL